jgi:hypothetical protein
MKIIMAYVHYLAEGNFPGHNFSNSFLRVKWIDIECPPYNAYFAIRIYNNKNILFNVGVERIPIMDRHQKIIRY